MSRAVALRQSEKRLDGDFDEETLAEDIDREDDAVGIARIVDEALKTEERAADDFDAAALREKGHHTDLIAGGYNGLNIGKLAEKGRFVGDGYGAREQILLVDARF